MARRPGTARREPRRRGPMPTITRRSAANLYDRLGVSPTATSAELRRAYRSAARDSHPDRHGAAASVRMAEINEAWRVLRDPVLRRAYDDLLDVAERRNPWPPPAVVFEWRPLTVDLPAAPAPVAPRRRLGWRWAAVVEAAVVIAAMVVSLARMSERDEPSSAIAAGDCVAVHGQVATAVRCSGQFDGVVESVIDFGSPCPEASTGFRVRTGRICIVFR